MGRGDRKTKRGKIWAGSYGKYRPKNDNKQGVRQGKVKDEKKNEKEKEKEKQEASESDDE